MKAPYSLAITAIFRDEAPYLKEWILFHRSLGVEFFHLFNNLSSDHYKEVLQPFVKSGVVKLENWPLEHDNVDDWDEIQRLAYERALYFSRGKIKWLAILDTDEFLFPTKAKTLPEVLKTFDSFGGVCANWQIFGSSDVKKIPKNHLLIEMLTKKLPQREGVNHTVKSIVRPERVVGCKSVHHMEYVKGYFQVNTDQKTFEGHRSPYVQLDQLRINHYRVRDEHFLHQTKLDRTRKWWNSHPKSSWIKVFNGFNQVEDLSILPFANRIKAKIID